MKNVIFFLFLVSLIGACTQDYSPPAPVLPICCGNVQAKFNGEDWVAIPNGSETKFGKEGTFSLFFGNYVDNVVYNRLYILNIPASVGKFRPSAPNYFMVEDTTFSALLFYEDKDFVFGKYLLLSEDPTNLIEIDSFDSNTKIFRGRFNLTLIADGKPYSFSPDTIHLTNGTFVVDCK